MEKITIPKTTQIRMIIASIPNCSDYFAVHKKLSTKDLETEFRNLIHDRMQHCRENLLANLDNAKRTCQDQIVDLGTKGHFSVPVYQQLEEALDKPMQEWTKLVWQQIVRQMYLSGSDNCEAFMYATEKLLVL